MSIQQIEFDLDAATIEDDDVKIREATGALPRRLQYSPRGTHGDCVIANGATAWWRFTEGVGNTVANEISGGSPDLTATTAVWVSKEGFDDPGGFSKQFVYEFDGTNNSQLTAADHTSFDLDDSTDWSLEFIISNALHPNGSDVLMYKGTSNAAGLRVEWAQSTDQINVYLLDNVDATTARRFWPMGFDTSLDAPPRWFHLVVTYDGASGGAATGLNAYIDGVALVPSLTSGTLTNDFQDSGPLHVGGRNGPTLVPEGQISHLAIYNGTELSGAQVLDHYNRLNDFVAKSTDITWSQTFDAGTYPRGADIKIVQVPGYLARLEANGTEYHHSKTLVKINGGAEVEVRPNEPLTGIVVPIGGTLDVIVRFEVESGFVSGTGPYIAEQSGGDGVGVVFETNVAASGTSKVTLVVEGN